MIVLGIHGGLKREEENDPMGFAMHDAAAVVIRDGEIAAAIEEERLNRVKHSNVFPSKSIGRCLDICELRASDLDCIAIDSSEDMVAARDKRAILEDSTMQLPKSNPNCLASRLSEVLGEDVTPKLRYCGHHIAHAWSTFIPCGFDESLVLSIDGDGDNASGMIFVGRGTSLQRLRTFSTHQSLGHFYEFVIHLLGYSRFDEYKVMALAPFGNPERYRHVFDNLYELLPEGNYSLAERNLMYLELDNVGLIAKARRKGEKFSQVHVDLAASLQATLETIVMHVLQYYKRLTTLPTLCLAGGVCHNCSLNGKVLYSNLFKNVFVQPAAHDAGAALGAAWWALYDKCPSCPRPQLRHLFLGLGVGCDDEIRGTLSAWDAHLSIRKSEQVAKEAARLLADGEVIGWVQGRSEFGPRALGNRSILADPRPASNKLLINEMVKKREEYRPFAPCVLEENVHEYFDVPESQKSFPFMVFVVRVREGVRALLGAVTHVDGTARVQTVSKATNPMYWDLINEFAKLTGVPVLLNTSFNNNAEPIVDSVDDAVSCFLTTGLNHLIVGPYIVSKQTVMLGRAVLDLVPSMRSTLKMVTQEINTHDEVVSRVYRIESTKSRDFGPLLCHISRDVFSLLLRADGKATVLELLADVQVADGRKEGLLTEIVHLWNSRMIVLRPATKGMCQRQKPKS